MRRLTTAIFPILYMYFVFRCFITHTSAGELHTTFPFTFLLHKNTTLLHIPPGRGITPAIFLLSIIPMMYFA
jgi:hypothetical protein